MAPTANCPTCSAPLTLTPAGSFDSWICPAGHGLAATLSELYEEAQEDEARRLWTLARGASSPAGGGRPCPMCTAPMVSIVVPTDGDEALEGEPGDTPDAGEVPVDVCRADQVIWFDVGELDAFPDDLPDAQPTPEQEAALADIRRTFGEAIVASMEADEGLADRLVDRMGRSSRAFRRLAEPTPAP